LLVFSVHLQAKNRQADGNSGLSRVRADISADAGYDDASRLSAVELENRFRPYFEERAERKRGGGRRQPGRAIIRPTDGDLFALMRKWDDLPPEFKTLYKQATDIPRDFESHVSPSGKFKIFYTTKGRDSVDVTDSIGYGTGGQPSSWRERHSSPNGVPDYVDEVAFALDSSWSMIIDRFGFPEPIPTPGPDGETDRYNVVIECISDYNYDCEGYGVTYAKDRRPGTAYGFQSVIIINSNWSDPQIWGGLGYDKRPYDAVRVAASHEFMHAVQYAIVRTYDLDNLTYGWLEGSAVLMEELAFPEINDYLQYIDTYFTNPRVSLLSNNFNHLYMNGLIGKYLYEKTDPTDSIGFVKYVHIYNRDNVRPPFHRCLEHAAQAHGGKSWAEVLNGFHAESYFTGNRSRRPWAFVGDAEMMNTWRPPTASSPATETKSVRANSVEFFRYTPQADAPDTLVLEINGERDAAITGKTWAASALVTELDGDSVTIVPVQINQSGSGHLELAGWREKRECLLVVTNGSSLTSKNVTVKILGSMDDIKQNAPLKISRNVVRRGGQEPVLISGGDIKEIKILTQDGKVLARWNGSASGNRAANSSFHQKVSDRSLEWYPGSRLVPGVYFISAVSSNPGTNKRSVQKRKIMVLP